ncbi:hypothetical protein IWQ47_000893 [Aquimarina sp. EL_43]|uniref:hypothetical protein n=1 Tax=unclassified Aquimarina TaxID=2627091 RepID=UPI0018C9E94B|nr:MULTISPECIES: hypothetical protein [unclassified Aquimarina]MBG6129805.1 hypothetical protein [Aquimarina sp. EL_35]MBG6150870.1 hypothetical protein [Aquimarina sp. EL_32]MBG6167823.1 hypothetical protein [Aquimarina sp. EL_43]
MELIFSSTYYSSYQSSTERCYYIDFGHKVVKISFCQLLSLRYKAKQMSTFDYIDDLLNHNDTVLLSLCDKEHLILLDTLMVLDFVDLMKGTFAMIELNAMLVS